MVDSQGTDGLVVILGSPSVESAEVYARTVTEGDPSWVGPLAGVSLGLPVYHVLEPEMKRQFAPEVYERLAPLAPIRYFFPRFSTLITGMSEFRISDFEFRKDLVLCA